MTSTAFVRFVQKSQIVWKYGSNQCLQGDSVDSVFQGLGIMAGQSGKYADFQAFQRTEHARF
jgi:hypothetical protein